MNAPVEPHHMHAYLTGEMDPQDQTAFESWLTENPQNQAAFEQFKSLWAQMEPERAPKLQMDRVWQKIEQSCGLSNKKKTKPALFRWWAWGFPLAAVGLIWFWLWPVATISVQSGPQEQRLVSLPDGSQVTLDSNSMLTFPAHFDRAERSVTLEGRAYFSVEHDSTRPFRVQTQAAKVTVLGTQFEVWTPGSQTRVWVAEGRVRVNPLNGDPVELIQNQQIACDAQGFKSDIATRNAQILDEWIKGKLIFERVPLHEVVLSLESVFGKQIEVAKDLPTDRTFTGQFERDQLANILQEVCLSFQYDLITTPEGYRIQARSTP